MTLSEIRAELLGQHAGLRSLVGELRPLAEKLRRGEATGDALREGIVRLASAFSEHSAREEALLRHIIPTVDAWGAVRAEIMDETHQKEHAELERALRIPKLAGNVVSELFDRILEHMEVEERSFLGEDVLRDDQVLVEFGG